MLPIKTVQAVRHELGDQLIYHGRRYVVRGFTRRGTPEQFVQLEDTKTGEVIVVPLAELEPGSDEGT